MIVAFKPNRFRHWMARGSWAVTEQALFAIANLAVNLVLARSLAPESYGAFGFCFATLLLLSSAQDSLLADAMLVLGISKYRDVFASYVGVVVGWHWLLSALSAAILALLGLGAAIADSGTLAATYFAAALGAPGILYMSLARGACYLRERPRSAALGGALNLAGALAGIALLAQAHALDAATAFLVMGAAGLVSGACMLRRLAVATLGSRTALAPAPVLREHWAYGRWLLATASANWVTGNLYYIVLPAAAGLAAGGALSALTLFVRPILTMLTPISLVLIPPLVRARGTPNFVTYLLIALIGLLAASGCYWALLVLDHGRLVGVIFGGKYDAQAHLLVILGLLPVSAAAARVLTCGLRAIARPDLEFRGYLVSMVTTFTIGVALVIAFGLEGAAMALVLSSASLGGSMAWTLRRQLSRRKSDVPA